MSEPIRIAMWSGPRNISTAMMRSFENRDDTGVVDEPFYAAFLSIAGRTDHPMRDKVLKAMPSDPSVVEKNILGPVPSGKSIFYQKHMAHHMVDGIGRDWIKECRNVFLIRDPEDVLASYSAKLEHITLADIGVVQQCEMFEQECKRLGVPPPVIESHDVLANPRGMLIVLCAALGISFTEKMLHWPAGPRATDGVWAPYWYASVERSTGFAPPAEKKRAPLREDLKPIAKATRPYYARLATHRLQTK